MRQLNLFADKAYTLSPESMVETGSEEFFGTSPVYGKAVGGSISGDSNALVDRGLTKQSHKPLDVEYKLPEALGPIIVGVLTGSAAAAACSNELRKVVGAYTTYAEHREHTGGNTQMAVMVDRFLSSIE